MRDATTAARSRPSCCLYIEHAINVHAYTCTHIRTLTTAECIQLSREERDLSTTHRVARVGVSDVAIGALGVRQEDQQRLVGQSRVRDELVDVCG